MKKIIVIFLVCLFLSSATYAEEVKIDHYEGKEFENAADAMGALIETSGDMAELAAEKDLDVAKMEKIHETSYITEDAVAVLKKAKKGDTKLLAEKLEAVHLSSEDYNAEDVRRHFIAYQAELNKYITTQK